MCSAFISTRKEERLVPLHLDRTRFSRVEKSDLQERAGEPLPLDADGCAVPVKAGEIVMGYVMFGQILPKGDSSEVKEALRKQFPERLHRGIGHEIDDIPIKSMEELKAAATGLQALTTFLLSQQWVAPVKSEFIRKLDSYIEQHMSEHISVEDACVYLHVGRTQSYAIAAR